MSKESKKISLNIFLFRQTICQSYERKKCIPLFVNDVKMTKPNQNVGLFQCYMSIKVNPEKRDCVSVLGLDWVHRLGCY